MARKMFPTARMEEESWVEYIQRSTQRADAILNGFGSCDWVVESRRRKWNFAGKVGTCADGRWTTSLLNWVPLHGRGRNVGHPFKRWRDEIEDLVGGEWTEVANDFELWKIMGTRFAEHCERRV